LSLAIGRRGQNVRLASQLSGSAIDIMTEADASEKRQREFVERSEMFQNELDVDETLAQLLVAEGFGALEEVAYVELDELASIEGFDDELGAELQSRATEALERPRGSFPRGAPRARRVGRAGEMPYLTEAMLVTLGKAGIKTLDDLADLATTSSSRRSARAAPPAREQPQRGQGRHPRRLRPLDEQGNEIIMAARAHWFEDEEPKAGEGAVAESSQ
jgi:N utilization substance protein A